MGEVAAHEVGHFLGNLDEYGNIRPTPGGDAQDFGEPGSEPDNVMNDPSGEAQENHFNTVLNDSVYDSTPMGKFLKNNCKFEAEK